jgi:hypothetical protein
MLVNNLDYEFNPKYSGIRETVPLREAERKAGEYRLSRIHAGSNCPPYEFLSMHQNEWFFGVVENSAQ